MLQCLPRGSSAPGEENWIPDGDDDDDDVGWNKEQIPSAFATLIYVF